MHIAKISNHLSYGRPQMFQSELYLIVLLLQKHKLKNSPCKRNLQCRLGHDENSLNHGKQWQDYKDNTKKTQNYSAYDNPPSYVSLVAEGSYIQKIKNNNYIIFIYIFI